MGVAICGMSPDRVIPEGFERWGMPWDAEWTKMDVLFDMHHPSLLSDSHKDRLQEVWQPLYMQEKFYDNATPYPLGNVIDEVGDYFSCSVAYMLGFAIYKKIKDLVITGVTGAEDYSSQRANLEYMIGVARGKGIYVHFMGETELMSGERYGFL